jgi:hypothetical protein
MLVLYRSLLNRGYILMKVLKALASIVSICSLYEYILMNVLKVLASTFSMCSLHVLFLSKITPRYFALFINGMISPFNLRSEFDGLIQWEK